MQMYSNQKHIQFVWKKELTINRTDRLRDTSFHKNIIYKNVV